MDNVNERVEHGLCKTVTARKWDAGMEKISCSLPKASQAKDNDVWSKMDFLKVSLEQVQEPFRQLGLLDDGVAFHKGFFQHSLPPLRKQLLAEKKSIAVLRMDGDMFESTMDILYNLYDLVRVGGCIIIDEFSIAEAREASPRSSRTMG